MSILNLNNPDIQEVINRYPIQKRSLLTNQLSSMSNIMDDNLERYSKDKGFREALDIMIVAILKGEFLGSDINEN